MTYLISDPVKTATYIGGEWTCTDWSVQVRLYTTGEVKVRVLDSERRGGFLRSFRTWELAIEAHKVPEVKWMILSARQDFHNQKDLWE